MRLFKLDENNNYVEVKTTQRLVNPTDATIVATTEGGPGQYFFDMQNGKVMSFRTNGRDIDYNRERDWHQVSRDESPAFVYDTNNRDEFQEGPVSRDGFVYPQQIGEHQPATENAYYEF